ncbi:MAG TPA: class I SAM-dependent methyltransferase [Chitinophagaceae bacterium]|nr:class I SAM-dependent methyltransferase [Chitinophagaceae bacterium]
MKSAITRFSDRVEDYIKYRPGYPPQMLQILQREIHFTKDFVIADIGSGTGISTGIFLANGNRVYAVEPNDEMRHAAELKFSVNSNFISVNGRAEKTNLEDDSIDLIFCAQSFHWFNNAETKSEFERILSPAGHIALVWNVRNENDPFQKEYEALLREIPDYSTVSRIHNATESSIREFFLPRMLHQESIPNLQTFDIDGFRGRLLSSSYFPKEGKEYERLIGKATTLFDKYQQNGFIRFGYDTKIYWC